jgi:hypothetical protein
MNTHLFFDTFSIKFKALKSQTEEKLQNSKKAIRNMNASKGFTDYPKEFKELVKAIEKSILPLTSQLYEDLK